MTGGHTAEALHGQTNSKKSKQQQTQTVCTYVFAEHRCTYTIVRSDQSGCRIRRNNESFLSYMKPIRIPSNRYIDTLNVKEARTGRYCLSECLCVLLKVLGGCVCRWVVLVCWVYVCVCVLTLRCADRREFLQPFLQCRQHTEVNEWGEACGDTLCDNGPSNCNS